MDNHAQELPLGAGIFLIIFGGVIDVLQFLSALTGIGILLNIFFFTPIAFCVFAAVAAFCQFPLFQGRWAWKTWVVTLAELAPVIDGFLPGWFGYALFITLWPRLQNIMRGIMNQWRQRLQGGNATIEP